MSDGMDVIDDDDWPPVDYISPLVITNWLLAQPKLRKTGLVMNMPAGGMSHAARLFQASMWRRYAAQWGLPDWHPRRQWVEKILGNSRPDCMRRARVNLYLALRIRRAQKENG